MPAFPRRPAVRLAGKAKPKERQKCRYCDQAATKSLLFSGAAGADHLATCAGHEGVARAILRKAGAGVTDVVEIDQSLPVYREDEDPILQMARQEPDENSNFGMTVRGDRKSSAIAEAPKTTIHSPQTLKPQDKGAYLKPFKAPKMPTGTKGKGPESFLRALGTDWKNMRMTRVHDNRMNVMIDGQRYTVYTRRG